MANQQIIEVKTLGTEKASRSLGKVDRSIGDLASSALKYAAAAGAIIAVTKKAIDAYGIQEQAEKRLEVATGRNIDALKRQAAALQQVTTFGDEMILGVQASIAAFVDDEEAIKKATAATLDLAAATGMDLKSAGDLVAKSLGSSTNALSRYGIEVTGAVGSTERLSTLTGNIADKFSGQAAAAAETMAGSMSQAKNAVGDLAEAMGGALSESIIEISDGLKSTAETAIEFFNAFSERKEQERIKKLGDEMIRLHDIYYALKEVDYDDGGVREGIWEKLVATVTEYKKMMGLILPESELWVNSVRQLGVELDTIPLFDPITLKETEANLVNFSSVVAQSLGTAFDPDMSKGDAFKAFVIEFLSLMEGVILASEAVSTALTFTFTGPQGILAALGAIAALEGAKSLVRNADFKSAATEMDEVITRPTYIRVGDQPGSLGERVTVSHAGGSPQSGGGVNITFNGNVTDREYVRGFIIPEIQKAMRLNA